MTTFTAEALVEKAAADPTNVIGLTTGQNEYWFDHYKGAGYFTWDGVTPATVPASGWFAIPAAQLESFFFVQTDPVEDDIAVSQEDPSNSGFVYFPLTLDPNSVPPAPGPTIGIVATDANKNEGNSGSTPFTFTLTRSGQTNGTNSVNWTVGSGASPSANALDFVGGVLPSGTVTFGPNETTKTITINVQGDTTFEPNEDFVVTLSNPTNGATIDPLHPSAQGLIINDDPPPPAVLSIAPQSAAKPEGNSGATPFTFTVTRSGDSSGTSTATWSVASGASPSADGSDFVGGALPSGVVTFAPGQTSQTVTVNVQGDTLFERNENFVVKLSNPTGATIDPQHASAAGIIQNDDLLPTGAVVYISPLNAVRPERPTSIIDFTFAVSRVFSGLSSVSAATVDWQVSAGQNDPIDAAAFFGGTFPSGSVTIPADNFPVVQVGNPGVVQTVVLTIPVQGNIDFQSGGVPEPFAVTLSNPNPGGRGTQYTVDPQDGTAYGFIQDFIFSASANDFNDDGNSDVLWQNADGTPQIWLMNGLNIAASTTLADPGSSWQIAAAADFNQDDKADIILQNSDGLPEIWLMNGSSITGTVTLPNPGSSWHVIAAADFNGDRNPDILWQNSDGAAAIWEMNGTSIVTGVVLPDPGPSWHAIGAGDFNGDGNADILWQNSDGLPAIWEMNGGSIISAAVLPSPGASWHAIGVGDFNGDGNADILWQNNDGLPAIWEMNGTSIIGAAVLPNPGSSWHAIGTSDFNGDGNADIIWQNADGLPAVWEMNGLSILNAGVLPNPGTSWHVKDDGPITSGQMTSGTQQPALHPSSPDAANAVPVSSSPDTATPALHLSAPDGPGTFGTAAVNPALASGVAPQLAATWSSLAGGSTEQAFQRLFTGGS